jgi:hypothetical protein
VETLWLWFASNFVTLRSREQNEWFAKSAGGEALAR